MRLVITTPVEVAAEASEVAALRAEDATGAFGILPGHADFLTALAISVVSWRHGDGSGGHCAVRGGVLTVTGGREVAVATREAVASLDLERLEHEVLVRFRAAEEEERTARTGAARLHLAAMQRLVGYLRPAPPRAGAGRLATARNTSRPGG